ncbi:MAG: type II toxin-antitoxin system VapC family toxin [Betaproteobacteria bacterium]|nr:type II toxin-antitoxin system VapC family toxin [Betaproteobacteria bacterium]
MILLDTHVLVWWLAQAPQLSAAAKRAIQKHSRHGEIAVSTISVLEIATAVRRGRLQFSVPIAQWLADMRCIPELRLEPVSADIAALAGSLPEPMHGDPADRIIAASATVLGAALVTADDRLRSIPGIRTIW